MTQLLLAASLLWTPIVASTPAVAHQRDGGAANSDALIQQDFQKRVDAYITLRTNAVKGIGPLKPTTNPAEIKAGQGALAERITAARSVAKRGKSATMRAITRTLGSSSRG